MIEKESYLKAKRIINARENDYAMKARKAKDQYTSRKLWGYCDGMKECLKILEECCENTDECSETIRD